jgi:tetratricopeptide (TPR) repeat protein
LKVLPASTLILGALLAQSGECPSALEAGRLAYQAKTYDVAAAEFERAERVCSNPLQVLLPLAQAQLLGGKLPAALDTLERLLKLDAKNTDALKLKGDVLYFLGREPEAEEALRSALALNPKHQASRYALARICYQQSRYDEATRLFSELIEQDPSNFRAHDNLALCYAAQRRDSDALKHFLRALDLVYKDHPEYDTVYANAANFFIDRSDYEKGFQLAAEAAKRNPSSARNFFLTGKALVKLEKADLSVRWLKQAAELDPNYTEPHYWLAQVYRRLGQKEDADRELRKFRELSKTPKSKR